MAAAQSEGPDRSNQALIELARSRGFEIRPCPELPAQSLEATTRMNDIFKNWTWLHNFMASYETLLKDRWHKKIGKQQRTVFLKAWPTMPEKHRPDLEALRRSPDGQDLTQSKDAFLLPHINQEDLSRGEMLPLFLHSRGYNKPDKFANADINSVHVGTRNNVLELSEQDGSTMYLSGQESSATSSRIVAWEDDSNIGFLNLRRFE